jgi:hypothetical protein
MRVTITARANDRRAQGIVHLLPPERVSTRAGPSGFRVDPCARRAGAGEASPRRASLRAGTGPRVACRTRGRNLGQRRRRTGHDKREKCPDPEASRERLSLEAHAREGGRTHHAQGVETSYPVARALAAGRARGRRPGRLTRLPADRSAATLTGVVSPPRRPSGGRQMRSPPARAVRLMSCAPSRMSQARRRVHGEPTHFPLCLRRFTSEILAHSGS